MGLFKLENYVIMSFSFRKFSCMIYLKNSNSLLFLFLSLELQKDVGLPKQLLIFLLFSVTHFLSFYYFLRDSFYLPRLTGNFVSHFIFLKELFLVLRLFLFSKDITLIQLFFTSSLHVCLLQRQCQLQCFILKVILKCVVILSCWSIFNWKYMF